MRWAVGGFCGYSVSSGPFQQCFESSSLRKAILPAFKKFPGGGGGGWMLDFSISSGPFSVGIETNSLRVDNDNVQDQDPSLTIKKNKTRQLTHGKK